MSLKTKAAGYVIKLYLDARDKRRNEFYDLMKFLDVNNTTAMKVRSGAAKPMSVTQRGTVFMWKIR